MDINHDSYKTMTKNPLGFFGLLMLLFESILGTVFSIGLNKLSGTQERLPMIWFLVLFPIIVLIAFSYIVISKPRHLYGPGDYKDDSMFIKATEKETKNNISKEIEEIDYDTNNAQRIHKPNKTSARKLADNIELSERIGIGAAEKHLGIILQSNMKYQTKTGESIYIDGYGERDGILYLVEVKMSRLEGWRGQVERGIAQLRRILSFVNIDQSKVKILLVIVVLNKTNEIENKIKDYVTDIAPFVDCLVEDIEKID